MTVIPLRPDLGEPKMMTAADGQELANAAMILEIARRSGTPAGRALCRAFNAKWRELEGRDMTKGERQIEAMRAALAVLGAQAEVVA